MSNGLINRQYVGARYVPKIMGEWNKALQYEALSVVTYMGNSFTSKVPVPANVEIDNEDYWINTGNYNAQIEYYRRETEQLAEDIKERIISYNNVSEMANSTELENGYTVKTLGFYSENDGGGTIYKVVSTKPSGYYIELKNDLYATIVKDNPNPKMYGAYGDGLHDDTNAIKNALTDNTVLNFISGTYLLSSTLLINRNHKIHLNDAEIKANDTFTGDYLIQFGNSNGETGEYAKDGILDGTLNCNNKCNGIIINLIQGGLFENIKIKEPTSIGIKVGDSTYVGDLYINNCLVSVRGDNSVTGMIITSTDNNINGFRTIGTLYGILIASTGNTLSYCHPTCFKPNVITDYYNGYGCKITSQDNFLTNFYSDGYAVGFYLSGFENTIVAPFYFTWNDCTNLIAFKAETSFLDNINSPTVLFGNNSNGKILDVGSYNWESDKINGSFTNLKIRNDRWRDCVIDKYTDYCLMGVYNHKTNSRFVSVHSANKWNILTGFKLSGQLNNNCKIHLEDDNFIGDIYFKVTHTDITYKGKNIISNSYTSLSFGLAVEDDVAVIYYKTNAAGNYNTFIETDSTFGNTIFNSYDNLYDSTHNKLDNIPNVVGTFDVPLS